MNRDATSIVGFVLPYEFHSITITVDWVHHNFSSYDFALYDVLRSSVLGVCLVKVTIVLEGGG